MFRSVRALTSDRETTSFMQEVPLIMSSARNVGGAGGWRPPSGPLRLSLTLIAGLFAASSLSGWWEGGRGGAGCAAAEIRYRPVRFVGVRGVYPLVGHSQRVAEEGVVRGKATSAEVLSN